MRSSNKRRVESKKRDGRIQEASVGERERARGGEGEDVVQRYDNGVCEIRLHIMFPWWRGGSKGRRKVRRVAGLSRGMREES